LSSKIFIFDGIEILAPIKIFSFLASIFALKIFNYFEKNKTLSNFILKGFF